MSRAMAWMPGVVTAAVLVTGALPGAARAAMKEPSVDGIDAQALQEIESTFKGRFGNERVSPMAIPDVFGPGAVLNVGNVWMKVTNFGIIGNPFTNVSSDPSGQWPGASSIEYLNAIALAVGAVNPTATDPNAKRRVSFSTEWRPATLNAEDRMYRAYDGIINGLRFANDDGDKALDNTPRIDEDFLDGHDNDGDGKIDEDHAALGQQLWSCVIRDDTPEAVAVVRAEKHVPLGLEVRQKAWAYSIPGFTDFNVIEWSIYNRSGHTLDSVVVGGIVDMDVGPNDISNYFQDDFDIPQYPNGAFSFPLSATDKRRQAPNALQPGPLCTRLNLRVNGFSIADDDGDKGRTNGVPTLLLFDHTIDPLGESGPARVGFRAFRSFTVGTPYVQGGNPTIDQQRYELMTSQENLDPESGFINAPLGDQKGDYAQWWSVGPWLNVPDGGLITVTIGFSVSLGSYRDKVLYPLDYLSFRADTSSSQARDGLIAKYPSLSTALSGQQAFEGIWEQRDWDPLTDFHGRETALRNPPGAQITFKGDCRDEQIGNQRQITSDKYTWFDFDCDYCTGVWVSATQTGLFHKTWNAEAPPPNPNLNVSVSYNYSDNPDRNDPRGVVAAGDRTVTLAWDNLSETTADPKSSWFDQRGYKIWKVANWTRPVGSPGPGEDDWSLIGEYRKFDQRRPDGTPIPDNRYERAPQDTVCPRVFIPNYYNPATGKTDTATVEICLNRGDLWDRQTGDIIRPDPNVPCVPDTIPTNCRRAVGSLVGSSNPLKPDTVTVYPIGRYRYVDREVKNGFIYFYSVTAFDSTGIGATMVELSGRRSAVEAEGVVPQAATRNTKQVWVVPNPYRGVANIQERSSSWDLTPNASDPTGTHVDFMGLPTGRWTIRIYTVSGDRVAEIHSDDPVNESVRAPVTDDQGVTRPGYNRQQDNPNDGQARWNLISRNGQDIVSGIYLFTVESQLGTQRGKFVVIR